MKGRLPEAVVYHYIRDPDARPAVGYRGIDPATFEAQLDDICRHGTPIGWSDLQAALEGGRGLPGDAILLTFDDGLMDHHRIVLPRLVERGVRGVFFVLARPASTGLALGHKLHVLHAAIGANALRTAVLDRLRPPATATFARLETEMRARAPSDPDDTWKRPMQRQLWSTVDPILSDLVRELLGPEADVANELYLGPAHLGDLRANGMTIGGHGRDHHWLDWVEPAIVEAELSSSVRFLAGFGGHGWPFAYPYGGVPARARPLLAAVGIGAAFTTVAGQRQDRFHIGRHDGDDLGSQPSIALRSRG